MASGKPIVATSIEGYSSVMTNEKQGFLVPPKNEQDLQEALETLIDDAALRREMGNRGMETAAH